MGIYIGSQRLKGAYIGNSEVKEIYVGTAKVFPMLTVNEMTAYVSNYGMRNFSGAVTNIERMYKNNEYYWAENSKGSGGQVGTCQYYGMDFSELQNKTNVTVTGFDIFVTGCASSTSYNSHFGVNIITDLDTTKSHLGYSYVEGKETSYTDLGDGAKYLYNGSALAGSSSKDKAVKISISSDNFPNALNWINNNLDKVISGVSSGTFGLNARLLNVQVKDLGMTLYYTTGS